MRQYVTLFEAPFEASVLNDRENNALRAGSLLAVPPPPLGSQPLAGSTMVDLLGNSLTQWATHVQDVASGMILPPEVAVNCPRADIVGVLNQLEGLTRVRYCRHCFGVSQKCRCSAIPHQAPGPTSALWTPPMVSYVAMVSSTETTASTSVAGVTRPSYPPPGMPPLEAMDTLPAPTTEGSLDSEEWEVAIRKFLAVMVNRKAVQWTDIKELTPLQFMPYVANLFREVMGKDLQGLSQFTGWIGLGGYYHWKVAQQGLLHAIPRLQGQPVPKGPMARPSGRPHPPRWTRTETPAAGASER